MDFTKLSPTDLTTLFMYLLAIILIAMIAHDLLQWLLKWLWKIIKGLFGVVGSFIKFDRDAWKYFPRTKAEYNEFIDGLGKKQQEAEKAGRYEEALYYLTCWLELKKKLGE